jgi:two-component system cell cycle sensor histidine kinase PleC
VVIQSLAGTLASWHSLMTLTTTLSTTTGCVVLILGFAFHWQTRRMREADLMYETTCTDISILKMQKEKLIQHGNKLMEAIADLRAFEQNSAQVAEKYTNERICEEELNQIKTKFLANMSHELRTPLNAIIGFSEIMESEMFGPLGADKYREYCGDIHKSGKCLLQVVTDIFDMSDREANSVTISDTKQKLA